MKNEDKEIYQNSQLCWICKQESKADKVRDHCHITAEFRGVLHNKCNLNLRLPKKMVKEIKAIDIFLMNNKCTYKMFEIHLILIHLKTFTIIT